MAAPSLLLTTKARVKEVLKRTDVADTGDDQLIDDLIASASQDAEDYLGRHLLAATRTEVVKIEPNQVWVSMKGFPITAVTSVKYSNDDDFTAVDALDSASFSWKAGTGQVRFKPAAISLHYDPGFVEVQYTGGMAATTDAFKAAYPRMEFAVREEVINRLNRAKNPEGEVTGIEGGVGYIKPLTPLKDFFEALGVHPRLRV